MKNLKAFSQSDRGLFLEKRLACFAENEQKAPEVAEPIKDKTPDQIKAIVMSAREDVDTQIKKMEAKFVLKQEDQGKTKEQTGYKTTLDANKPKDKAVLDAYAKLKESYKALDEAVRTNISANKDAISRTLTQVDTIFAALDKNKTDYQPLPGDPLGVDFNPLAARRAVEFAATAAPAAAEKATVAPGVTEAVNGEARLNQALLERLRVSDEPLDKSEADGLKKLMGNRSHVEIKSMDGDPVIMDRSTDGKFIRFQITVEHNIAERTATQAPSEKKAFVDVVRALDGSTNVEGAKFSTPTESEKTQKNLETNQQELSKQLEYLQSEKCPVGTMVVMTMTEATVNGREVTQFNCIQKNADEKLQYVTMIQGAGETSARMLGQPRLLKYEKAKDDAQAAQWGRQERISPDERLAVTADQPPVMMENKEFTDKEVSRKVDSLASNIAAATVFGTNSDMFKNLVAELKTFSKKHNFPNYMLETDTPVPTQVALAHNEVIVSRPLPAKDQKKDQPMQYAQVYSSERKNQTV